jgi:TPP-dependent pyruvate/acetoin dehydrogenase alpha subunit
MREAGYRSQEEIAAWKARCPVATFAARLLADGTAAPADLDAIEAEIAAVIAEADRRAQASPLPDPATVERHVYHGE